MKDKILLFIIGMLVGAIIATAGFLIYNKVTANNTTSLDQGEMVQMNNGEEPPEKPDGDGSSQEEPPEKPDGETSSQEEPPAKPEGEE